MHSGRQGNFHRQAAPVGTILGWWIVPIVVLSAIWIPILRHYQFVTPAITDDIVAGGRPLPPDAVLEELSHFYYHPPLDLPSDGAVISAAEQVLAGRLDLPGLPPLMLRLPFEPEDLERVPPEWQLELPALRIPNLLLEAYERSARQEFLVAARESILAWASYERRAVLPNGLLWNDHAIAARSLVLSNFWRIYRRSPLYRDDTAKVVFEFAARSAQFLAHPAYFTFSTNHGVMQNLALWHLALSFPTLPKSAEYADLAMARLREQMPYYVSEEGVILEHSAWYQEFGLNLLSVAFRYMTFLDIPIDVQWREKYEKAKEYWALLRRPDRTLPTYGDTWIQPSRVGPPIVEVDERGMSSPLHLTERVKPQSVNNLFPVSGYFLRWEGLEHWPDPTELNQTVMAWSYFPGHGHKHADEMSVLLWANGETWLTNRGYRPGAEHWDGSNAPHLRLENDNSVRETEVKFSGWSDELALIDVERKGAGDYVVRRELVRVKPHVWLIFDQSSGSAKDVTTTSWITPDGISWQETEQSHVYVLKGRDPHVTMTVFFAGSSGTTFRRPPGAERFGTKGEGTKVGLITEQPADGSWALSVWVLNSPPHAKLHLVGGPIVSDRTGAENWAISLPAESGGVKISRDRSRLVVADLGNFPTSRSITLSPAENVDAHVKKIRTAYEHVAGKYPPRFRDLLLYRTRASAILVFFFIVQELEFMLAPRRWYARLRLLNCLCWLGGGVWLHFVYLA